MRLTTFSVIMPCYNAEATLGHAVASVLSQTRDDLELIIVDDGSSDGSLRLARSLASEDRRIRVLSQSNAGPASARNFGLAVACGAYLAFLDADDAWHPAHLQTHLTHFEAVADCGISFGRVQFYDPEMREAGRVSPRRERLLLADVLGEYPPCTTSNLVCRREVYREAGGFDVTLTHGEDQEFIARTLIVTAWQIYGVPDITVHYRTSPAGLSANLERTLSGWRDMLNCVREYAPEAVNLAAPEASAIFHRYLARRALRTGQPRASLRPMLTAWLTSPAALLTSAPGRTLMTTLGVALAQIPGNPARALLAR